jgi:hypothetical protein
LLSLTQKSPHIWNGDMILVVDLLGERMGNNLFTCDVECKQVAKLDV